jgi:hypothetical protein
VNTTKGLATQGREQCRRERGRSFNDCLSCKENIFTREKKRKKEKLLHKKKGISTRRKRKKNE